MKKLSAIVLAILLSCQKEDLKLINPNSPSLSSLHSEAGLKAYALGLYDLAYNWNNPMGGWFLVATANHSGMGDELYMPWGDWNWRWEQQYSSIKLPDGQVVQHTQYPGISQKAQLQKFNTRNNYSGPFLYEWAGAYYTIGQANKLISTLENALADGIKFSGNADTKIMTLKAWALWWKGFMYSRIGSMYVSGLIVNELGKTSGNYMDRSEIINEANRNFDEAVSIFNSISADANYNEIMTAIVPDFCNNSQIITPDTWKRMINTYKARNLLVNKRVIDMAPQDWIDVATLTANGLKSTDNILTIGYTPNGVNDFYNDDVFHPFTACADVNTYYFASERLIQEFKPGDARMTKNFHLLDVPEVNKRNRGWIFGTRYGFVNIEDGGSFSTVQNIGQLPISPTYEENQLMLAEAKLRTGDVDGGLTLVDEVRTYQSSSLAAVSGTGISQVEALEELRRERRVSLFLRGLAFYDARRWGVIDAASAGGGRAAAMIVVPADFYDPEGDGIPDAYPCFLDYNYMDYWDVPADEVDLNKPLDGSAPVKG